MFLGLGKLIVSSAPEVKNPTMLNWGQSKNLVSVLIVTSKTVF